MAEMGYSIYRSYPMKTDFMMLTKITEDEARQLLERIRWGNRGAVCPFCGCATAYKITPKENSSTRKGVWKCKDCRKQFTVTVGTIFHKTKIPLKKWLLAIFLMCSSKKGISSHQLHRTLGITQKSAWFMCQRIRYAITQAPLQELMKGKVEVDETYIGGKSKGKRGHGAEGKVPVVALVERGGELRAKKLKRLTSYNLKKMIREHVAKTATIYTDEFRSYGGLNRDYASHQTFQHGRGEYVRGEVYTNTLEGCFALMKRWITGAFHHVSEKHLDRYIDEFVFRWNSRKVKDSERTAETIRQVGNKRLTYEDLKKGIYN